MLLERMTSPMQDRHQDESYWMDFMVPTSPEFQPFEIKCRLDKNVDVHTLSRPALDVSIVMGSLVSVMYHHMMPREEYTMLKYTYNRQNGGACQVYIRQALFRKG